MAQVISLVLIMAIIWAGFAIGLANAEVFDLEQSRLVLPLISLLAVLLLFLGLALFLSQVLPSGSAAGLVSGFVLIASFFITSLAQIDDRLETLNRFSPLRFYQGGRALTGLDLEHLVILLGISALLVGLAWLLFAKRDLRFGGTGWLRLVITKRADNGKVDSPDRRQMLAHIHELMQEKDYPAAKKSAEVFVSQFPDQPEGWLLLAGLSEPAESLRFVRKARELAPADPRVDEAEAWAMERMDLESETKPVQVAESQQAQESNRNR